MLEARVPWALLRESWALRDSRYRDRQLVLNEAELEAVKAWRGVEVERVPGEQRARAYLELRGWKPPDPSFGRRRRIA